MEVVSIDLYLKKNYTQTHRQIKKNTDVNLSAIRTTIWHRFSKNMYNLHTSFKFNVVTASHQVCNILLFRVD